MSDPEDRAPGWRSGILLVDKPQRATSHDVVAAIRRLAHTRKVGHAGTLDPMATGLLVLGIGSSTRLLTYLVGADKEYGATIRLGASTTTDDADGERIARASPAAVSAVTDERIRGALETLTGEIAQVPSAVSAIKVDGKRAYTRVRAGEDVRLDPRTVTVSAFDVLETSRPGARDAPKWIDLSVRVECSSGTYVRALARDLGTILGVGGHLTALRRTRVGPFLVADAVEPSDADVSGHLLEPAAVASVLFERCELTEQQAIDLGHGKRIVVAAGRDDPGPIAAISPSGALVGLIEFHEGEARSLVNFPPEREDAL